MALYTRSLFSTKNIATQVERYYMMVCDAPRRISKAEYMEYKQTAIRKDSMSTESTKKCIRHFTTCYYDV